MKQTFGVKEYGEVGIIIAMVLMVLGWILSSSLFFKIAFGILLVVLILPKAFKPFAILWFGLSVMLGKVSSVVLLTVIYSIVLLPVGFLRRLLGFDTLNINQFKKGNHSVFKTRYHHYLPDDISKPY